MKLICAWCQKVIRDGPEEPVSHGVCPECARRVARQNDVGFTGYSCWTNQAMGSFLILLFVGILWLAAALCSEGLHCVSGGRIPRFIQWELPQPTPTPCPSPHKRPSLDG